MDINFRSATTSRLFIIIRILAFIVPVLLYYNSFSQNTDTLISKLDSLSKKTDQAGKQNNNTSPAAYSEARLNVKTYSVLLISDLKQAFTKPFHMTGRDWKHIGIGALITGGLALADKPVQRYALTLRNHNQGVANVSKYVTNFGGSYEGFALAAFGAYGLIFKSDKMVNTTLLATQSYITGTAVETMVKLLSGRTRPSDYSNEETALPSFKGPFAKDANGQMINSAFPSGHTTVAFAAATVFAMEYKNRPWVPIFAYSAATLIGLSRITENKHWATDVFAGAALGYLTGRLVVNNYHRYAKIKAPGQVHNRVFFNLQYNWGHLSPAMVYRF